VIAMGSGDAADESVQAQAAKVVGHSARGILSRQPLYISSV